MPRIDSGFDESYCLKASEQESSSIIHHQSPPPPGSSGQSIQGPSRKLQAMDTERQRPVSEKHSRRRSAEPRRKSITASSDNSTKSRSRGNGSKPSSRRTSCTLVDPARPARHYRIKSSQTVPTVHQDIDDVLALHFRSCTLFQSPTYQSSLQSPCLSGYGSADTDIKSLRPNTGSAPAPQENADGIYPIATSTSPKYGTTTLTTTEKADTTMHWTSPDTRRKEYEKIDRANSGLRGLLRKILPRCVSGPPPPRFYEEDKSDTGSVRRYRMDFSDDEEFDEKSASLLRHQSRKPEPSRPATAETSMKRWRCFAV